MNKIIKTILFIVISITPLALNAKRYIENIDRTTAMVWDDELWRVEKSPYRGRHSTINWTWPWTWDHIGYIQCEKLYWGYSKAHPVKMYHFSDYFWRYHYNSGVEYDEFKWELRRIGIEANYVFSDLETIHVDSGKRPSLYRCNYFSPSGRDGVLYMRFAPNGYRTIILIGRTGLERDNEYNLVDDALSLQVSLLD